MAVAATARNDTARSPCPRERNWPDHAAAEEPATLEPAFHRRTLQSQRRGKKHNTQYSTTSELEVESWTLEVGRSVFGLSHPRPPPPPILPRPQLRCLLVPHH